ncbi:PPE family protein [Mycobacterium intermedium]|uniref:PPE family protein n=1 Tax=Mycobacterium intermedium TaxID=28445 RepID=A0A1E3S6W2_MYCIE|nr:PPE family protein [Mycobacterium intermedium]MCV6964601.1 PPE family protein [Mycobacterium intermedium]ODQ97382.1 hypothetical protein BHQ20_26815 [Mycobacterium intermedium]OPE46857.1 PPE family protein [Mycobacterium intermedium]ORA96376.1 PPE family protein [Mycobacterium intermedium]
MDFGALPPEVNSGRIYAGPGSAPHLAAAAAWDGIAAELHSAAAVYNSAIAQLTSINWHGPSATSMAEAAAPYIAWLGRSAAQAEQAASQSRAAAAAFDAVFAATVPPPEIAANRALLASLVATNLLGQNTPAIAATEADYAEMWAQDAAAMYAYAGASAAATQLDPFTSPPVTTNTGGAAAADAQTLLSQLISQIPNAVQSLASTAGPATAAATTPLAEVTAIVKTFNAVLNNLIAGPYTPLGWAGLVKNWWQVSISIPALGTGIQGIGPLLHPKPLTGALAPLLRSELLTGGASALQAAGSVAAGLGRASSIGSLSVPANWASAVPAVRTIASQLPETIIDAGPAMAANAPQGVFGQTALSSLAGRAVGSSTTRAVLGSTVRIPGAVAVDDIATSSTVIVIPPDAK